jgi:transposase
MKRFIQGEHRGQGTFLPESLDDYITDTNPVRVVDVFVDELDLVKLGFEGMRPAKSSTQFRKAGTWCALKFRWAPVLAF